MSSNQNFVSFYKTNVRGEERKKSSSRTIAEEEKGGKLVKAVSYTVTIKWDDKDGRRLGRIEEALDRCRSRPP